MSAGSGIRRLAKRVPGLVQVVNLARVSRDHVYRRSQDVRFLVTCRALRRRRIDAYLRTHLDRRLHLGTGSNVYEGWLNTDITDYLRTNEVVYLDARRRFPLPDGSFDLVFAEHMIEHLTYAEGLHCLRECHRVLRSDGRIRLATPSIEHLIRLYGSELTDLERRYLRWSIDTWVGGDAYLPGFVVNNMFHNFEHRFVYDRGTLRHALESCGFVDVEEFPVGESCDPRLRGLERHARSVAEFNELQTMALEARRP
jgi:predicted SAM-dependent methyltransferase